MIKFIIMDWVSVNRGLLSRGMYIAFLIYNLVMIVGFPVSILPTILEYANFQRR